MSIEDGVELLSVSEVTRQIKDCIEGNFPYIAVVGELSGVTRAGSGHVYLTLKDEGAQLRGVMWRSAAARLRFEPENGLEVVALGRIELYAARGSYQLIVEQLMPQGLGPLEVAFRQLHAKLAAEGLFEAARKRPIPRFPRRIALVTSPTGAAVRDMLQVITRRWSDVDVLVVPVPVQGDAAAPAIAEAIRQLPRLQVDVAVVGRGGGSLEDLWAFNEEAVARAIADCTVPIVSAVGHEIDVTIADLVADRRALTPSEAGELVVPSRADFQAAIRDIERRLAGGLRERIGWMRSRLNDLRGRRVFAHPCDLLVDWARRIDDLESSLRLHTVRRIERSRAHVAQLAGALDALSPLKVLSRGYSITQQLPSKRVLRDAGDVIPGDLVQTRLAHGTFLSRVVHDDGEPAPLPAKTASRKRRPRRAKRQDEGPTLFPMEEE